MKISFISDTDWSNCSYHYAKALESLGYDSKAYAFKPHPFKYENHAEIFRDYVHVKDVLDETTHIIYMHSMYTPNKLSKKYEKQIVFHGGSIYRQRYKEINEFFNKFIDETIIQTYDLWDLGAERKHWILPPMNTDFEPVYNNYGTDKRVFIHFPSSSIKGTDQYIKPVFSLFKDKCIFICSDYNNRLSNKNVIENMKGTDVVVDCIYPPEIKCGHWGFQALEAASLGKIVITNNVYQDKYELEYSSYELWTCNNKKELKEKVAFLLESSNEDIMKYKIKTRKWCETNHSYEAIGKRLEKLL